MARSLGWSPVILATAVVAALVAGACGSSQPPQAMSTPPDPVLAKYRSTVDLGWDELHRHGDTWSNHCGTGPGGFVDDTRGSPAQCRADSVQMKADAQRSLDLLAAVAVKPELQDLDRNLKQALGEMPAELDQLVVAIDAGNVQAQHDLKARISKLWSDAWFAVDGIDCWPKGVQHNGAEAQTANSCVST